MIKLNKNLIMENVLQNIKNSYLGTKPEESEATNGINNIQNDIPSNNFTGLKSSTTYNANHLVNDAQSVLKQANKSIGKDYENK